MTKIIFHLSFLFIISVGFSQNKIDEDFKKHGISVQEYKHLLQESLDLNHIDYFFSEEEKTKPLVVLKSQYISPIIDGLQLKKFDKPVQFKTCQEIYEHSDLKFIDFMEVFMIEERLTISYGLYKEHFVVFAEFIKCGDQWKLTTRQVNQKPKTIVNLALTEGVCLSQLLKCKLDDNRNEKICNHCLEKYPNLIK